MSRLNYYERKIRNCIPNFLSYTDCNVTDSNSNPNCNTLHCCYPCTSLVYSNTEPLIHCVKLLSHCTKLLSQNYPTALKYSNTVLNYSHTALKYSHTAPPNYSQTALKYSQTVLNYLLPNCTKIFPHTVLKYSHTAPNYYCSKLPKTHPRT